MTEFLAENNICGQNLLEICAVGNAIIAELFRLKNYLPDVFRLESKADQQKYSDIVFDFNYFRLADAHEKKIENNSDLQDLDEEFRDNNIEIIARFYLAFESIHEYVVDLKSFIEELNDGMYIQQTLETVLQDIEGKQLMCESLYLYGTMLLVLDLHIPGPIRERLLVSYYRYNSQKSESNSNIDDVCKLLRSTEFTPAKRPTNYPEEFFKRIELDSTFIEMVVGRLRSEDIYNQITIYPLPEHRTTALANQAAMLYVCLYFSPKTLHTQSSRMREIVDKFFSDNWLISMYMGVTVNLLDAWDPYVAAKNALHGAFDQQLTKELFSNHLDEMKKLLPKSREILKEGVLSETFLVKNNQKIIKLIRELNVTLRWLMLHSNTHDTAMKATASGGGSKKSAVAKPTPEFVEQFRQIDLFELLLNTSQLELKVRDILKKLLTEKNKRWDSYKGEAATRVKELSEVFSGTKPLVKIDKNDHLRLWFMEIYKQIDTLDHDQPNISGRKIIQLIQALEEVQEFHNLNANMQVQQHLNETRQYLHQMVQTINVKETVLVHIQMIGDLSYAWRIIDKFTQIMQESIKEQPSLVIKLRATFLKLASALEIPLLRINQAGSEDLISVSRYYSHELVKFVRKVMQIIPETMFNILSKIIELQTEVIQEIPTRLEKEKLKEYAQLDNRFIVAKLTYQMSVFTEGILMMKTTLVGIIELDPKQLLEDGIRKELVKKLAEAFHTHMSFNPKAKDNELDRRLSDLQKIIDGYRRSFEYVQDYINIQGLKIYQEEMGRIINYNVEKECNNFLRNKIQDWKSKYQSESIPIPTFPSTDLVSMTFIGRLAREILRQTDPKTTIYVELSTAWFDGKNRNEVLNNKFFTKIIDSIGPSGLIGLDKLYSFMIVSELQQMMSVLIKNIFKEKTWLETLNALTKEVHPSHTGIIPNPTKFYGVYLQKFIKIWPKFLEWILKLGQIQLLRKQILFELNTNCKFASKHWESALRNFNQALILSINVNKSDPERALPGIDILHDLNKYLEWAGLVNPFKKIYLKDSKNSHYFPMVLFVFVIAHLPKLQFNSSVSALVAKKPSEQIDGNPMVVGVLTLLRQLHPDLTDLFIELMGQFIMSHIDFNLVAKNGIPMEAQTAIHFLIIFVRMAEMPKDVLKKCISESVLDEFEYVALKV